MTLTSLTGEQLGIHYSDNTPDLVYAFNSCGFNTQITDWTGRATLSIAPAVR